MNKDILPGDPNMRRMTLVACLIALTASAALAAVVVLASSFLGAPPEYRSRSRRSSSRRSSRI